MNVVVSLVETKQRCDVGESEGADEAEGGSNAHWEAVLGALELVEDLGERHED